MIKLWDGIRMNSQAKVQDEIKLHNQEMKVVNAHRMEIMQWI